MENIYFHCHNANAFKDYHYWPWPMDKDNQHLGCYEVEVSKEGTPVPELLPGQKIYTLVGVTQDAEVINTNFPEKNWIIGREYFVWQQIIVEEFEDCGSQYLFRGPLFHAKKAFRLNDLDYFQELVKNLPVDSSNLFAVEENHALGKIVSQMEYNAFSQQLDKQMEDLKFWHKNIDSHSLTEQAMMQVLIDFEPQYIFDDTIVELEWDGEGWMWR